MKTAFLSFVAFICFLAVMLGLSWVIQGNDFFLYRYFAPKVVAVQRQVFEQSYSYNSGMARDLQNARLEYIKATPEEQAAIASVILQRFAGYDETQLPLDDRAFLEQLRNQNR
jgi:hypothetical protein